MNVVVIDYGMGNLNSVRRAFEECEAAVEVIDDPNKLKRSPTHLVLPGVGAFSDGMTNLINSGWVDAIKYWTKKGVPILGICLGMQLLADKGYEGELCDGLGLISGTVEKLIATTNLERIPHVGWNQVSVSGEYPLMKGINSGTDFYFVHSYHFLATDKQDIVATTPYCHTFTSIVAKDNVFGVQFHPEKSHKPGFRLIGNFCRRT